MKKLTILFLSLITLAATVTSCNNNSDPAPAAPVATSLDLTFKNQAGKPVPGVFVTLYSDSALKVAVDTVTTGSTGMAVFSKNLKSQIYYIDAATDSASGCLTNYTTVNFTSDSNGNPVAIPANKASVLEILLVPTGFCTLTNSNDTDAYNVYTGETPTDAGATQYWLMDKLDKGISKTYSVEAGIWDFKFIKLDSNGNEITGSDILKPANAITACNTATESIP